MNFTKQPPPAEGVKKPGLFASLMMLAVSVLDIFLVALVLTKLWDWSVVAYLDWPSLSYGLTAVGLLFLQLLRMQIFPFKTPNEDYKGWIIYATTSFGVPALILLSGYLCHVWIH